MSHVVKSFNKLFKKLKKPEATVEDKMEGAASEFNDLSVEQHEEKAEDAGTHEEEEKIRNIGKLFVGGLNQSTKPKELEAYFSRFGKVCNCSIPIFPRTGKSQGFGFVTFMNPDDAKVALQTEVHVLDGKLIDVRLFELKRQNKREKKNRLFLGGLPYNITEEDIRQCFSRYGEVVDVVIPLDKISKKTKGYAFLSFQNEDAAEKCETDRFVYLGGRQVQIKKAVPQNHGKESGSSSSTSDGCLDDAYEVLVDEGSDNMDTQSVASGTEFLPMNQNPALKKLFENYFIEKLASLHVMNNSESVNKLNYGSETCNPQHTKDAEVEKLLADFLTLTGHNNGPSGKNLIEFSDEETESEDETESSDEDTGTTSYLKMPEVLFKNSTDNLWLSVDAKQQLSEENSLSKTSVSDGNESSNTQKSMPLQIRNREGFLMCTLCQWISPNDSVETFLAHCKTSVHKSKLKDRFPSVQTNKEPKKVESKPKTIPGQPLVETSKKQKKVENIPKCQEQSQRKLTGTKKRNNKEPTNKPTKKKDSKQTEKVKNSKIRALAKGMACILPLKEDELMCTMCDKNIPKALDFDVLMKNVTAHLQSKTHLKNLSETENSLISPCGAKATLDTCEKNEIQKNKNQPSQKKKVQKGPLQECIKGNKAPVAGKPQNAPKNTVPTNNPQKKKPIKKKQNPNAGSSTLFLCLPCNVTCLNTESFNVHLSLKSHSDTLVSKNVKGDVSLANMGKCKGCQTFLYGSLYLINKHYSKCVEKKN